MGKKFHGPSILSGISVQHSPRLTRKCFIHILLDLVSVPPRDLMEQRPTAIVRLNPSFHSKNRALPDNNLGLEL